jgi:hypothetical protein
VLLCYFLEKGLFLSGLDRGEVEALRMDEDGQDGTVLVGGFTIRVMTLAGFVLVLLEVFNC